MHSPSQNIARSSRWPTISCFSLTSNNVRTQGALILGSLSRLIKKEHSIDQVVLLTCLSIIEHPSYLLKQKSIAHFSPRKKTHDHLPSPRERERVEYRSCSVNHPVNRAAINNESEETTRAVCPNSRRLIIEFSKETIGVNIARLTNYWRSAMSSFNSLACRRTSGKMLCWSLFTKRRLLLTSYHCVVYSRSELG